MVDIVPHLIPVVTMGDIKSNNTLRTQTKVEVYKSERVLRTAPINGCEMERRWF